MKLLHKLFFLIEFHQSRELRLETPYYVTPKIINARIYRDGYGNYHRYTKKEIMMNQLNFFKSTCCYIMRNFKERIYRQ